MTAIRSYEANLTAFNTHKDMLLKSLGNNKSLIRGKEMRIESFGNINQVTLKTDAENREKPKNFQDLLKEFIQDINQDLITAKEIENKIAHGKVENLQEALYLIEKADISFRLLTEIRNKALESYQEIMRMQV